MLVRLIHPTPVHHFIQQLAGTRPMAWVAARTFHHIDAQVLRITHGRKTLTGILAGLPVIFLTTTGARSGQPRRSPLLGIPDGDTIVIIGTNFGQRHHPAWYHNLRANPQATIAVEGRSVAVVAREAEEGERERYWRLADATYAGFAAYRRRVGDRRVPILILTTVDPVGKSKRAGI